MRNVLNHDGPLMSLITKITYSAYLNILWLVCCLPIVTIGASTTALFYVTLKVARNEEGNLTRSFFHSFKENFKNITILEDNSIELQLDSSVAYHALTEEHYYGIDLSNTGLIRDAGFQEPVYLGILANSPRHDSAVSYLIYLFTK